MSNLKRTRVLTLLFSLFLLAQASVCIGSGKKALTFEEIMKFQQIESPTISNDGSWVAYSAQPDRGDGDLKIQSTREKRVLSFARGAKPVFSNDSRWLAAVIKPTLKDLEAKGADKPKQGLLLVNVVSGDTAQVQRVETFAFSEDSRWFVYHIAKVEKKSEKEKQAESPKDTTDKDQPKKKKENVGTDLILRNLTVRSEIRIPFVLTYVMDTTSNYLVYSVGDTTGATNGVYVRNLSKGGEHAEPITQSENALVTHLTWSNANGNLTFLLATMDEKEKMGPASLWIWDRETVRQIATGGATPEGWMIPSKNDVVWSKDGKRLFFGLRPMNEDERKREEGKKDVKKETDADLLDVNEILKEKELDVWHWNDPRINPHQKKVWKDVKDKTFRMVYHLESNKIIRLADPDLPAVEVSENSEFAIGTSDVPYLKEITWDGNYSDIYVVSLRDGARTKVTSRLRGQVHHSRDGRWVVFYRDRHWFLYDVEEKTTRNITEQMNVAFYDEDDDTPALPTSYGFAGWVENNKSFLIYDRFDVWQFSVDGRGPENLTKGEGRTGHLMFRIQKMKTESKFWRDGEELLLTAHHIRQKHTSFFTAKIGVQGVSKKLDGPAKYSFVAKAKNADAVLFTRQSYTEFPNLWMSDLSFKSPRKLTDLNPQIKDFAWGNAELVEWNSVDGKPLQGVLIKPGNYDPKKRYPVLVYFYELFSQRLYDFNQMVVNHRPNFPFYASNDYAVFLPDVRYDIGQPGYSATKCLVPGVQKLIEMGVADPKAIGLHGHSWSGYQTAFVITQTNMFAAAIAGAPVGNMTSAYSGIRLETGLARQFQYEQQQSRIGRTMWEARDLYIENSPIFFADRIKTPLLIQFGDEDEAVPWQQGIELYLAMRRLEKDCVMLQYRGEPHHLKKFPNKLDYSIKFKEYLDHYLKGGAAPEWLKTGIPYRE